MRSPPGWVGSQPASTYAASAITGRHGEARELVLLSVLMLVRIGLLKVRTAELMLPDRTPASGSSHVHLPPRFGARWLTGALAGAIFDALPVLWVHRPSERSTDHLGGTAWLNGSSTARAGGFCRVVFRLMHDRFWRRYSSNKERLMPGEFDLVAEVPAFPAYALPPDAFPGFSAGSYGGSARGGTGIANVEYVYRPDYDVRGRMVGVSNTRPSDGGELLRQSPLWWASAKARIEETMTGEFPLDGGVVTGVGARYMGEARAEVEGTPCRLQRWTTLPEHSLDDALSVIRVRIDESWVTLWSNSYSLEELEALVPRLKRVEPDLLDRLRLALADWMRRFEERRER